MSDQQQNPVSPGNEKYACRSHISFSLSLSNFKHQLHQVCTNMYAVYLQSYSLDVNEMKKKQRCEEKV